MSVNRYEKINPKTNDKVITTVTKRGNTTNVRRDLEKSDGLFGSRVLGTKKNLSNKTRRRG